MHEQRHMHCVDQAPNRMEMIVYGRNYVLNRAMKSDYDDYKFLIMTDMDFRRGWVVSEVLDCFNIEQEWDAITANGINGGTNYYDRYAFRDEKFPLGPELIGEYFWADVSRKPFSLRRSSDLKKVYSAFGGLGIYKREALMGCSYAGYVTEEYRQFLEYLINNVIADNNQQLQTYKKIIGINQKPLPVKFQANCGYDGPVCVGHATMHACMITQGHDKIFVNPKLRCIY